MKKFKKLIGLLLTAIMVLSMTVSVFATTDSNTKAGEGNFTLTIKAHEKDGEKVDPAGYEYEAYQIFSGDLAKKKITKEDGTEAEEKTLSNVVWGNGVNEKAEGFKADFPEEAKKYAEGLADGTIAAETFAANIAKYLSTVIKLLKNDEGDYSATGLTAGYYLVQNSAVPGEDGAYTRYILEVVGDVTAVPKSDVPTSDKVIVEDGNSEVKTNEAAIGETVNYKITGTLPDNYADYKEYYYVFTDTLSKGLTYNADSVVVKIGDQVVTDYFYKTPQESVVAGRETVIRIGIADLRALEKASLNYTINKDSKIVVTYSAVLNEYAEIGKLPNKNDVILEYSNDPNHSGNGTSNPPRNPDDPTPPDVVGKTPLKEVETYTTELAVLKVDEEGKTLTGATFELSGNGVLVTVVTKEVFTKNAEGEYYKLTDGSYTTKAPVETVGESGQDEYKPGNADKYEKDGADYAKYTLTRTIAPVNSATTNKNPLAHEVDQTGRVTFTGLGVGTYTLKETVTPAGYNTSEDITFTIAFDDESKMFTCDNEKIILKNGDELVPSSLFETTIVNQKGSILPSTGGIGTTIFYIVGGILVVGAGVLLVTKSRMKAK